MSVFDSVVKKVSNLPSTLGQKTMAGSLAVALASDQVAPVSIVAPGYAAFHQMVHIDAGQWAGAKVMRYLLDGASQINLTDIIVSTDTAMKLALHQATLTEYADRMVGLGPVALWKLDEASGDAADYIGSKTLTATATPTYGAESWVCTDGKAVQLNGSTQGFKTNTKLPSTIDGAFECWFWLDITPTSTMHIASASDTAGVNDYWRVSITTARKTNLQVKTTAGGVVMDLTADFTFNLRQWYHLVWNYTLGCFVNGRSVDVTGTGGSAWYDAVYAAVDNFVLGYMASTTNTGWFQGKLALCAWYANAKNAAYFKTNYDNGAPIFGPHQFAANGIVAVNLRAPITTQNNFHSIYVRSSASATATVELVGYEK